MTKARSLSDFIESDGSVTLVDNQKIKVGTGNDLEIYHDGNSKIETSLSSPGSLYIASQGSSNNLYLRSDHDIFIEPQGDVTLDSPDEIVLDADGGNITFKDGGTAIGQFQLNDTNHFKIGSKVSDGDIRFFGNDGGSNITALILDMSAGGSAIFNHDALFADNGKVTFGAGSDLQIYHDGANNYITCTTQDQDLIIQGNDGGSILNALSFDMSANGAATFNGPITANAGVVVDNITIDGTTASISGSADFTIDSGGRIDLSADDNGEVRLFDGSSMYAQFKDDSDRLRIESLISDADMLFVGNDGGSEVTALTLDMSEEGDATFNNNIKFGDNGKALFGAGLDLALYSDGTNGKIESGGDLILDVTGDIVLDANGGDINLQDGGTQFGAFINSSSDFKIRSAVSDKDLILQGTDGGSVIDALTLDMSEAGAATFNNNVTAFSDERLKDNIETLEDGLDKVEQLRGVTYTRDGKENIGVIAQEVEKILPEIVLTADDEMGTKSVDYSRITAVLIEAVKDLSARVKELEDK